MPKEKTWKVNINFEPCWGNELMLPELHSIELPRALGNYESEGDAAEVCYSRLWIPDLAKLVKP